MTPPFQRYPLILRVLLMFSMFMFNMGVVSFLASRIAEFIFGIENSSEIVQGILNNPTDVQVFLFVQGLTSLGGFVLTSMMFAVLEAGEFKHHLRLSHGVPTKSILVAVLAVISAQFFIEYLVKVNETIPLPSSLNFLIDYQKRMEELLNAMMNFHDFPRFITAVIVMAVIPAIGEEFFFRGLLLGDLLKARVNPVVSIIATGFIFSLSHFEYNNILAIGILGSFLGYLYYSSGSLWLPIAAHFTNNFLAVLLKYLYNLGYISEQVANAETPLYLTIISAAIFAGLTFLLSKWRSPYELTIGENDSTHNN